MFFRKKYLFLFAFVFLLAAFFFRHAANANPFSNSNADSTMIALMKPYSVSMEGFGKKEFYSWTTSEQIKELRGGDDFLSRSESPTNGKALYDIILSDTAYDKFPIATILRRDQFAKKRFAWIDSWATVMGWKGENYGNQLLKITLKDSAIVVAFYPFCESPYPGDGKHFAYEDVNGKRLDEKFVFAHQDRIAAVYFSANKIGSRTQIYGSYSKAIKMDSVNIMYREYVICNESMIASWEYGTVSVKKEMNAELSFLNRLTNYATSKGIKEMYCSSWYNVNCWASENMETAEKYYTGTIAIPNDFYLLNPAKLQKISATLTKALSVQGEPMTH